IDVSAIYYIDNSDSARTVTLMFFSLGITDTMGTSIELDGAQQSFTLEAVAAYRDKQHGLNDDLLMQESWIRERYTPLPGTDDSMQYGASDGSNSYLMTLRIPAGRHTIRVKFHPGVHGDIAHEVVFWQYVYLLAPARDWG